MAGNILTALFSKASLTILNQTRGMVVAKGLKVVKGTIRLSSESFGHSLEDGTVKVDSRIIKPSKVVFDVICPDLETVAQVNDLLLDRQSLYQITSRGIIMANLQVNTETLRQSAEMTVATPIRISFQQILIQNVSPIVFANSSNSTLIDRGISAVNNATSTVKDLFDKTSGRITTFLS